MFKKVILNALCLSVVLSATSVFAEQIIIKNRQQYVVKEGDTLWDISNRFLAKPWYWKEIWKENPNIKDPNTIYPNDIISVEKIDGKNYITLSRNSQLEEYQLTPEQYVKLSPSAKSEKLSDSIGLIDQDKIKNYFSNNIVTDIQESESNGSILKSANGSLISGTGDEMFVYYKGVTPGQIFNIYSNIIKYKDSVDEELTLGYEIVKIGEGTIIAVSEGDVGLMKILSTKSGIRAKYKIMPKEKEVISDMFPSKPVEEIKGNIISLGENVSNVGLYDVILIDKGYSSNLEVGNILSIKDKESMIKHPVKEGDNIKIPGQNVGLVMLYKVYDNLSYGVIVRSKSPIKKEHIVTNPE